MIPASDLGTISLMISRINRPIWLLLCMILGCQAPDLTADIDEHANLINDANDQLCECHQEAGYGSLAECSDSLGLVGVFDRDCIASALEGNEREGEEYLMCANAAYADYLSCLTVNALTCPDGGVAACRDLNTVALGKCDQLPAAVEAAVAACTSP